MKTIKAILEYNGIQKEIIVPNDIVKMDTALDLLTSVDDKYLLEEVFPLLYESVENYFVNEACKLFNNEKLYTEGFLKVPFVMRKMGIYHHIVLLDDDCGIRCKFNYADDSYRY